MIKKIQVKDLSGNITGTYDVGLIEPENVQSINDLVSNKDRIINTCLAFNNSVFTTSTTGSSLILNSTERNIRLNSDLVFGKNKTVSSADSVYYVTESNKITATPQQKTDEAAEGFILLLSDLKRLGDNYASSGYSNIKFNITVHSTYVGVTCRYISNDNTTAIGEDIYIQPSEGQFTVTLELSEIQNAINNDAYFLFFFKVNDSTLMNNQNVDVYIEANKSVPLECEAADIITLVNWAKTNHQGPWTATS